MPNFTTTTTITTARGDTLTASKTGDYNEVINVRSEVDNRDAFTQILAGAGSVGAQTLRDVKSLIIRNSGSVGAEILIQCRDWTVNSATDAMGSARYDSHLLGAGEYIYIPNQRFIGLSHSLSGGNAYTLDNQAPHSDMYVAVNNPAAGDAQLLDEGSNITNSVTNFTVDDGDYFRAGDLIRLEDEIMEVTSVATNELYVIRGTHGSTKATHNDDVPIRFPFFNAYADFDKYSVVQTDASGRFKCMNFFGYGRTETAAEGLVAGSVSGKFYQAGYQELGMSGITPSTKTGLAASTAYAFDIAVDGGSDHTLSFTTDSSNGNFGGRNGLIQKIQDALDTQFYTTSSNLLSKKVTVGIVGGDIRFTSGQHLSGSAISITAPASGTTPFGVGAFTMAVGAIEAAVAARLPDDTIMDRKTGQSIQNIGSMFYDDGHGNIKGACTGTINYETGAIDIQGCPPNAEFVVSANYGSAHSGGNKYETDDCNSLTKIAARSCNSKINTTIEIIGLR